MTVLEEQSASAGSVPQQKVTDVDRLTGSMVPFSVADVTPIEVALSVFADTVATGAADVVKLRIEPLVVFTELVPITRK